MKVGDPSGCIDAVAEDEMASPLVREAVRLLELAKRIPGQLRGVQDDRAMKVATH